MQTHSIQIKQQEFVLHPSGAVYWSQKDMLLIADVHLGKVSHFRKHGSAVPLQAIYANFDNLDGVVQHFKPAHICFLGDLFHSYINEEWLLFASWVARQKSKITLVSGNHDIIAPQRFEDLDVQVKEEWRLGSLLLTHIPELRAGYFNLAGHIHPGVQLNGIGLRGVKVSCFHKTPDQMVIPAFGTFTGHFIISPTSDDHIFAIADDQVIPITAALPK